jgi:hypothetical protein
MRPNAHDLRVVGILDPLTKEQTMFRSLVASALFASAAVAQDPNVRYYHVRDQYTHVEVSQVAATSILMYDANAKVMKCVLQKVDVNATLKDR